MILIMGYQMFYYVPKMKKQQEQQRAELAEQAQTQARQPDADTNQPVTPPPVDRVVSAPGTTPGTTLGATPDTTLGGLQEERPDERGYIRVTTPLYEVTLSTAGAEVVAAHLLQYETNDDPVQLIAWEEDTPSGAMSLALAGDTQTLSLSHVHFDAYAQGARVPLPNGSVVQLDETSSSRTLVFRAQTRDGHQIERFYTFSPDTYVLRTGVSFVGTDFPFARELVWSFGPGMRATENNVVEDHSSMRATVRLGEEVHKKSQGNFAEEYSGMVHWAALQTKYFTAIVMPENPVGGEAGITGVKDENFLTAYIKIPVAEHQGRIQQDVDVYLGPLDYGILEAIGKGLEKNINLGFDRLKIFKPVSRAILWSMTKMHKVIPNYGIVILLLSVFAKILFYRLTHKSFKSMRDMQALQPKMQAIKEKFKEDRQRQSQETMKLYKEAGVNPLGGCLPMVLQMPVFIALFNVLRNTIEVRRAPFVGWIDDLSQQDVLATLPFSLPVIGNAVSVLPLLMGVSMLLQSKIGGSLTGPSSSAQPKAFTYMLPIVFTFLFYKMPSGLVIYWIVNTVLSVAQQYYINKGGSDDAKPVAETPNNEAIQPPPTGPSKSKPKQKQKPKSKAKKG